MNCMKYSNSLKWMVERLKIVRFFRIQDILKSMQYTTSVSKIWKFNIAFNVKPSSQKSLFASYYILLTYFCLYSKRYSDIKFYFHWNQRNFSSNDFTKISQNQSKKKLLYYDFTKYFPNQWVTNLKSGKNISSNQTLW